jgi:hypothetical protein
MNVHQTWEDRMKKENGETKLWTCLAVISNRKKHMCHQVGLVINTSSSFTITFLEPYFTRLPLKRETRFRIAMTWNRGEMTIFAVHLERRGYTLQKKTNPTYDQQVRTPVFRRHRRTWPVQTNPIKTRDQNGFFPSRTLAELVTVRWNSVYTILASVTGVPLELNPVSVWRWLNASISRRKKGRGPNRS